MPDMNDLVGRPMRAGTDPGEQFPEDIPPIKALALVLEGCDVVERAIKARGTTGYTEKELIVLHNARTEILRAFVKQYNK